MQIIITPGSERLVDQADIAKANKIMRDIEAGDEEVVPADIVRRLIAGENKVKVWRSHRGLSGCDIAATAGAPFISEIQSGKKVGSVGHEEDRRGIEGRSRRSRVSGKR